MVDDRKVAYDISYISWSIVLYAIYKTGNSKNFFKYHPRACGLPVDIYIKSSSLPVLYIAYIDLWTMIYITYIIIYI